MALAVFAVGVLFPAIMLNAQQKALPEGVRIAPISHDLSAGILKAEVLDSAQAGPHAAGSPAFASISVTPDDASLGKRGVTEAELTLSAVNGTIRAITGQGVTAVIAGNAASARINGLRHASTAKILVEMTLRDSGAESGLKVILRDKAGQASRPVTLKWSVRDCAGDYYKALQKISEDGGSELTKLITTFTRREAALPSKPIFRIDLGRESADQSSRCVRYERQWDVIGYRWRQVCMRYAREEARAPAISASGISREERQVLLNAAALLRTGGADPKLTPKGSFGWVSGKVAQDLRHYLKQDKHPALCTGAIQFTEYYSKHLSGLKKHIGSILKTNASARGIAKQKVDAVKREAASLPGGHPGIGLLPLRAIGNGASGDEDSIRSLILTLAPYAGLARDDLDRIAKAGDELEMLKAVKAAMDASARPDAVARTVMPAFALIESAYYLGLAEERYRQLNRGYIGSLEAIRAAHDAHCVCKS